MTRPEYRFKSDRFVQVLLGWLLLAWLGLAIDPVDRLDWLLENLLVFVYGVLLAATYGKFRFSNLSYLLFALFMTLHLIGAHYTYTKVPLGFWLQDIFSLDRNHYDRLVHFGYGLLLAYPFQEVLLRVVRVRRTWSYFLAVNLVLAFSGFFEIIEAIAATLVDPELGAAYLGIQGDEWDAQKDMFLACLGATIAMLISLLLRHRTT